jgi:hypothetical protein
MVAEEPRPVVVLYTIKLPPLILNEPAVTLKTGDPPVDEGTTPWKLKVPPLMLRTPPILRLIVGAFGVIVLVNAVDPPETFKLPVIFRVNPAEPVNRSNPEPVDIILKLPAIVAPFNAPNKFKVEV